MHLHGDDLITNNCYFCSLKWFHDIKDWLEANYEMLNYITSITWERISDWRPSQNPIEEFKIVVIGCGKTTFVSCSCITSVLATTRKCYFHHLSCVCMIKVAH